jgi:hypothetical protein
MEVSTIDEMAFEGNEFSLNGFEERYESWLDKKKNAFEKRIAQLEEEKRRILEEKNRKRQEWANRVQQASTTNFGVSGGYYVQQPTTIPTTGPEILHEQLRLEVISLMDQQQTQARDSSGNRWIKCEKCGLIDTDDKFASYGGQNHINLGICYSCSGIKRPV